MIDFGIVFGVAGFVTGGTALIYARTQAVAARAQAQEARRVAELEIAKDVMDRVQRARDKLVSNKRLRKEYETANPAMKALFEKAGGLELAVDVRYILDAFHDTFLLRKAGIIQDAHWHVWSAQIIPWFRMPSMQVLLANGVQRGMFEADFAAFFDALSKGEVPHDPLAR